MLSQSEKDFVLQLLRSVLDHGVFPARTECVADGSAEGMFGDLAERGYTCIAYGRCHLTLKGLRACDSDAARKTIALCNQLRDELVSMIVKGEQPPLADTATEVGASEHPASSPARKRVASEWGYEIYNTAIGRIPEAKREWPVDEIARRTGVDPKQAIVAMTLLEYVFLTFWTFDPASGMVKSFSFNQQDRERGTDIPHIPDSVPEEEELGLESDPLPTLTRIEIDGYRPLTKFTATLGTLTVVIGANGSGKSTLLDLFKLLASAAEAPIPPEIDIGHPGRSVFRVGGDERINVKLTLRMSSKLALTYGVVLSGPLGNPSVVDERLSSCEPKLGWREPFPYIITNTKTPRRVVRTRLMRSSDAKDWKTPQNELVLRRALDPNLGMTANVQAFISSWKFFSGFDVLSTSPVRKPAFIEPQPTLASDGSNLSSVLFSLSTEYPDVWEEIETHLRSAVPAFQALRVKAVGKGTVMGFWKEAGLAGDLTLADLSDGTLRLLCWLALCHSPTLPPFLCVDEPEVGLHPRVLPLLAGLFRTAAARTQIIITTHSPYFLTQFTLEEIAVMRRADDHPIWVRPANSEALQREVREIGGDAIGRLHISDELEARS